MPHLPILRDVACASGAGRMPLIFCRQPHTYLRCSKNAVTPSPFPSWPHKSIDPFVVRRPPHRALADKRFSSFQNVATSARNVLPSFSSYSGGPKTSSEMPNQEELLPFCPLARLSGIAWVRARSLRARTAGRPGGRQFEGRERRREGEREKTHIVFQLHLRGGHGAAIHSVARSLAA